MSWEQKAFDALVNNDIEIVAYLPDSIIDGLIDLAIESDEVTTVRVAREEEAVSILGGAWLGGKRGALICQSSGLANCFNALGSHIVPVGLPFVGLVTWRGDIGENNYAQVPAGYPMPKMLDDLTIRNRILEGSDDVQFVVEKALETSFVTEEPYILLIDQTVTEGK